jgi:predicted HTH domain antitoxin
MRTLTINYPDSLDLDEMEARMVLATRLYERGRLSLGQAAELVGLSKRAFMEVMGAYGVSIFNYPTSDLDQDVENAGSHSI